VEEVYDLITVGGGPAGMTAGIYVSRLGLKALLITKNFGGQIASKPAQIDNYPGVESIGGMELIARMKKHLESLNAQIVLDEVVSLTEKEGIFTLEAKSGKMFYSKSVILTSGTEPRKLGIKGEDEFAGKGVSYCAVCDGPIFRDKAVAVIGGGNVGFETAIFLSEIAKKIHILEYSDQIRAFEENIKAVKEAGKTEIITNAEVKEIKGGKLVSGLVYRDLKTNETKELSAEGVFVVIGYKPLVSYVQNLVDFNGRGEIVVDSETMKTKTPGLFAAGDVTVTPYKQIVIAAGEGAKAALTAYKYLKGNNIEK